MPFDVGSATGYLLLDTSGFMGGLKSAGKELDNFSGTASNKLKSAGSSLSKAGSTLTKTVTVPLLALGGTVVKTASNFESSMSQVQATLGVTSDSVSILDDQTVNTMDSLSDLAKQLGASTKFSATEAAAAINNMAMAGYSVQEVYDSLPQVLSLASAGALDLDYATQLVANGLNVMGMDTKDAAELADKLAVTSTKAYGSVSDFGEGLLVAGAQAKLANVNLTDTMTALGILGDNGISASEGGTYLRNTLKNLYTPTTEAAAALKELGVETANDDGSLRDFQDVLKDLGGALDSLTPDERIKRMKQIFDTRTISAANALIANSGKRWDELSESIDGAAGSAKKMADTQLENLQGQLTILKSSLEGMAIAFGTLLMPLIKSAVEKIQKVVDWINNLSDAQKEQILRIAGIVAAVGPALLIGGKVISMLGNVGKVFNLLHSPVLLIIGAIAALVIAFGDLGGVSDTVNGMFGKVGDVIQSVASKVPEILSKLMSAIQQAIPKVIALFQELFPKILNAAVSLIVTLIPKIIDTLTIMIPQVISALASLLNEAIPALIDAAVALFEAVVNAIPQLIPLLVNTVTQLIQTVIGSIKSWLPKLIQAAITLLETIVQAIPEIIPLLIQSLPQIINTIVSSLVDALPVVLDAAITLLMALIKAIPEILVALTDSLPEIISTITETLLSNIPVLLEAAIQLFMALVEAIPEIVVALVESLPQLVDTFLSSLIDPVKGLFDGLWKAICDIFGISPDWFSENVTEPVKEFFTNLWSSITQFASNTWEKIKGVWDAVSEWFMTNVIEPIATPFREVWGIISVLAEGCWEIIKAVWAIVSEWFNTNVIEPVKKFFNDLWSAISSLASSCWDAIVAVWKTVTGWFNTNVINPVKNAFSAAWNVLKQGASKAWEGIKSVFSPVVNWFKDKFSAAWTAVKNVFSTGGKIFTGITEGITAMFKRVVNAIIGGLNRVIAVPFNAINRALDKIRGISILGLSPFSGLGSISVPQIPLLAQGGVLKKGQIGLLEGTGAEAVIPLEKNLEWIQKVARELYTSLYDLLKNSGLIDSVVYSILKAIPKPEDDPKRGAPSQTINNEYNFYSPQAIDPITARKMLKQTAQQLVTI